MIRLVDITKKFYTQNGDRFRNILKKINVTFPDKGLVSILGPSGCGKTTFLNIISMLDSPDSGQLYFDNVESTTLTNAQRDTLRHLRIGYIYQEYNLITHLTVYDNIALSFNLGSTISRPEEKKRINALIKEFHLEKIAKNKPNSLSGGEKERVAIARAIANDPDILLADEPTGALDGKNAEEVMRLLKRLSKKKLVIMVSHNQDLVDRYSDRIINMKDGAIIKDTDPIIDMPLFETAPIPHPNRKAKARPESIFKLAWKRIKTKWGRYLFVVLINALGVTGISLTMAAFNGAQRFADRSATDALRKYPLTVASVYNGSGNSFMSGEAELFPDDGKIHRINDDSTTVGVNTITDEFVNYLKTSLPNDDIICKTGLAPQIMAYDAAEDEYNVFEASDKDSFVGFESIFEGSVNYFRPLDIREELVTDSYDILAGHYPQKDNEAILMLDKYNYFPSYALDLFGIQGENIDFNDILGRKFKFIDNDSCFNEIGEGNEITGHFLKSNTQLKEEGKMAEEIESHLLAALKAYDEGNVKERETRMKAIKSYFEDEETTRKLKFYSKNLNQTALGSYFNNDKKGVDITISCVMRPNKEEMFSYLDEAIYYPGALVPKLAAINRETKFCKEYEKHIMFKPAINDRISIPETYSIFDNANAVGDSNTQKLTGVYNYFLNRKTHGIDDSLYEVRIFCRSFEAKEGARAVLDRWNDTHEIPEQKMHYSDIGNMVVETIQRYVGILIAVLYAVIAIVILSNTMVTSLTAIMEINSRRREIGIYRSLGGKSSFVRTLFMTEQGLVGLSAGVIGIGVAYAFIPLMNTFIEHNISAAVITNFASLQWYLGIIVAIIALFIGLASTFVPSILATRDSPSKALRVI